MTTSILNSEQPSTSAEFGQSSSQLEGLYISPLPLPAISQDDSSAPVLYQWQHLHKGQWSVPHQGGVEQILSDYQNLPGDIVFVVPSGAVVTRSVAVSEGEKRLFKKSVPFQLEEDIIDDVEDLHFVFSELRDDSVDLAYVNREILARWLVPLIAKNISVNYAVSRASLLPAVDRWCFALVENLLEFRLSRYCFGAVGFSASELFLKSLVAKRDKPAQITLLASDNASLSALENALPDSLKALVQQRRLLNQPLAIDESQLVNLAVDHFYPRIPLDRWWAKCKLPLLLLAIGVGVHLLVALVEWQISKNQIESVKTAITERYRSVVPAGAISDPLKQLRNQVDKLGNSGSSSNALFILAHSVPVLTSIQGVEVKNLQFINDAQELRLTIQAPTLADIDTLSASFKAKGFGADVLSVNVNQGVHQARLKVTRK